jgi:hypothetical protein
MGPMQPTLGVLAIKLVSLASRNRPNAQHLGSRPWWIASPEDETYLCSPAQGRRGKASYMRTFALITPR